MMKYIGDECKKPHKICLYSADHNHHRWTTLFSSAGIKYFAYSTMGLFIWPADMYSCF